MIRRVAALAGLAFLVIAFGIHILVGLIAFWAMRQLWTYTRTGTWR